MNGRCPRCQSFGRVAGADAESLCSTHAREVLEEIVDEVMTDMRERPLRANDDPECD